MKALTIFCILLSFTSVAYATDNHETEDVSAESDAAMADTKAVKDNLAKEHQEAQRDHNNADSVRQATAQKHESAVEEMTRSQNEIQALSAEKTKIKEETDKLKLETVNASKTLADNKIKIEKTKQELAALKQLHDETNKRLLEIASETDKTSLELKELGQNKTQAAADFSQVKEDEKVAAAKLQKLKSDETQKQAQVAINNAAANPEPAAPAAVFGTTAVAPTAAITASTPAPVEVQRSISSTTPADSSAALILKRDCKIYDRTTKDPQVIGTKSNGTTIVKTEETKYWIGFSVAPDQKGFMAKTCF